MSRAYINPSTGRQVSRQRAHQLRNVSAGMCRLHKDRPANGLKELCEECTRKYRAIKGVKKPHPSKAVWDAVDFSMKPKDVAAKLGVSLNAVYKQRNKRGYKPVKNQHVSLSKRTLNAAVYDLLASLKAVVKICDRDTAEFSAAKAAIAKATGKPFVPAT